MVLIDAANNSVFALGAYDFNKSRFKFTRYVYFEIFPWFIVFNAIGDVY